MSTRSIDRAVMLACLGLTFGAAQQGLAVPLVYEGFQYVDALDLNTQSYPGNNQASQATWLLGESDGDAGDVDGTGFASPWAESTQPNPASSTSDGDNWYVVEDSISFGDLTTAGNRVGFGSNTDSDGATRALTTGVQTSIQSADKVWFSILVKRTEGNQSASRGGFAITNTALKSGSINNTSTAGFDNTTAVQGFGFGAESSHQWRPYAWDGTQRLTGINNDTLSTTNGQTDLLIGEIDFDADNGDDVFKLYSYVLNAGEIAGGSLNLIDTITINVDQSTLGLVNLNRQRKFEADEIRIGTELNDVIPVPEPSSLALFGLGGLLIARRRRA